MNKLIFRLKQIKIPVWTEPLIIFAVCCAAYGLVIPWLGFYWDDWAFLYIRSQLGAEGLTRYFATNRPFIAWIPQLTIPLFGTTAWKWHVFMLVVRAISGISVWWLIRLVWKRKQWVAIWVAFLFSIYPGFDQQPIAINYSDFFLLFTFLILSFIFSIKALHSTKHAWLFVLPGLLLGAYNHLALEYFFLLEFLRPVLLWISLDDKDLDKRQRLKRTALGWLPFLLVWLGAFFWRFFIFDYQTNNYEIGLLEGLRNTPLSTLWILLLTILGDAFKVVFGAWGLPFQFPALREFGLRSSLLYVAVIGIVAVLAGVGAFLRREDEINEKKSGNFTLIGAGLFGLLIAGWPFWMTNLPVGLQFATSRFTLPFILGVSLILVGLVNLLPGKLVVRQAILAVLVGLAAGYQIRVATEYRRDWNAQKNLLWQLAWRAPAIKSGTVIVANDTPIRFASDNSLVAPLNWIYAPDNHGETLDYMFFYPSIRLETALKNLEPGMTIRKDYLAASFTGNTDQLLAIEYQPPGCVRVLDPVLDINNQMLPLLIRQAASLSKINLIEIPAENTAATPPKDIFGEEPPHDWCYYFEKADLARQQRDWNMVAALGDEAFQQGDYPNDPAERLVFIEGYAHTENWDRAIMLTREAAEITPLMQPVLCSLWHRIEEDLGRDGIPNSISGTMNTELECTP